MFQGWLRPGRGRAGRGEAAAIRTLVTSYAAVGHHQTSTSATTSISCTSSQQSSYSSEIEAASLNIVAVIISSMIV